MKERGMSGRKKEGIREWREAEKGEWVEEGIGKRKREMRKGGGAGRKENEWKRERDNKRMKGRGKRGNEGKKERSKKKKRIGDKIREEGK